MGNSIILDLQQATDNQDNVSDTDKQDDTIDPLKNNSMDKLYGAYNTEVRNYMLKEL